MLLRFEPIHLCKVYIILLERTTSTTVDTNTDEVRPSRIDEGKGGSTDAMKTTTDNHHRLVAVPLHGRSISN